MKSDLQYDGAKCLCENEEWEHHLYAYAHNSN